MAGKIFFRQTKGRAIIQTNQKGMLKLKGNQRGLIGFFDILGYQNLLENNSSKAVAEKVIPIFSNIDTEIKDSLKNKYRPLFEQHLKTDPPIDIDDLIKDIFNGFHWLIFSDTILLSMPIESGKNDLKIAAFFASCSRLMNKMFDEGLPLRGAIDFGDYYIEKNCFAGETIVEAYKLSNLIELSACVLSTKCRDKFSTGWNDSELFKEFYKMNFVDYLIPTKLGENIYSSLMHTPTKLDSMNIKEAVYNSFWAHNKIISKQTINKVNNTEQWFYFLKMKKEK